MSPSRQDYPSSLYPEVGSSHRSAYSNSNSSTGGYSSRRNNSNSNYHSHGDYPRSRDYRHRDRDERRLRDTHSTNSRRGHSQDRNRDDRKNSSVSSSSNKSNGNSNNNTIKQRTRGVWEKFLPPEFRPSQADPEARHHRLSKEHESAAFDWTPGVVLALMGTAALFSVEKSLVRRRQKDYVQR